MRITGERCHSPIRHDDADEHNGDCDRRAEAHSPGVVEADVADSIEAVVEGDEEERDVDGDEPGVLEEAALDDFEREARGSAHFGGEVLDPEVHDKQHEQGGACDALQVPVDGASGHRLRNGHKKHEKSRRELGVQLSTMRPNSYLILFVPLCVFCG